MATDLHIKELLRSEMNKYIADFMNLHFIRTELKSNDTMAKKPDYDMYFSFLK